jgi:hypothetical protein
MMLSRGQCFHAKLDSATSSGTQNSDVQMTFYFSVFVIHSSVLVFTNAYNATCDGSELT